MKIEIVESGKEVVADYAVVIEDLMFNASGFGESKKGNTVAVQCFIPKGATIFAFVKGKKPFQCQVTTDSYLCVTDSPRMVTVNENTGEAKVLCVDEVAMLYIEDEANLDTVVVGNDIFSVGELSLPAPRKIQ